MRIKILHLLVQQRSLSKHKSENRLILIISALPVKTFAGYQFVAQHCNEKDYVLFVDDDVFIKLIELKEELKKIQSDAGIHGRFFVRPIFFNNFRSNLIRDC